MSYFRGRNYFEGNDGAQNYSVFQPMLKDFKNKEVRSIISGSKNHTKNYTFPDWKYKGFFDDFIKLIIKINNKRLCPGLKYDGFKSILEFGGR